MTYLAEFKVHWPNLLGAILGLAVGSGINAYTLNLFGPVLIAEFGWKHSQFALIGSQSLFYLLFFPVAGRFVDRFGVRIAAGLGFTVVPLCFVALSFMGSNFWEFYAITMIKGVFGLLTASLVFARVVVERFDAARGMALSAVMTSAPLASVFLVPMLGSLIESEGWRVAYRTLAAISATGGMIAIVLVGLHASGGQASAARKRGSGPRWGEFFVLARQPLFYLLIGGMLLINLPQVLLTSQLGILLRENGASASVVAWLVSLYGISAVIGRATCGFALDRFGTHLVAGWVLGLPALGFLAMALPFPAGNAIVLVGAILVLGLAQGAEGDVGAYYAARNFDTTHYSFIYSLILASVSLASAVGSLVLSFTLARTGDFDLFLYISVGSTVAGALVLFSTGRFVSR